MPQRRFYGHPDENQAPIVDLVRTLDARVAITTIVGKGFPDLVVGFRNQTHLVEIKKPGGELRQSQKDFVRKWPAPIWVIDNGQDLVNRLVAADRTERGKLLMLLREARMDFEDGNRERCLMWMPQLLSALEQALATITANADGAS